MTREDTISRQAVIEQTYNWSKDEFLRVTNPFDYLRKRINSLPSVKPQEQKIGVGHQIKHELKDEDFNKDFVFYECSCCSDILEFRCNYCHNCGVKFEGENE